MVCKILSQLIWLKVTFDTDTRQKNLNSTASKYETFTVQICCGNCTTYSLSSNYFIQTKCCSYHNGILKTAAELSGIELCTYLFL